MTASRRLLLLRHRDPTGVSGTGVVAEGVQFSDGTAVLRWHGEHRSTVVYEAGVSTILAVHGHNGATEVVYLDPGPDSDHGAEKSADRADDRLCGMCGGAWPCERCSLENARRNAACTTSGL